MNILRLLQTVDRRFLYAMLLIAVCLPFFVTIKLPIPTSPPTQAFYDAIEALPPNSFVLFGADWSAGSRGENGAQTEAIMRHLMQKKLRFGILCFDQQSKTLCEEIAKHIQGEYGYQEGVNWVNWGYKVDMTNYLKAFVQDIPRMVPTDARGIPVGTLPVMQGIKTARDISFLVSITPSATYQTYIQFVQGPYKDNMKMGLAPTSVMVPEAMNYVDSKQLAGLVPGLKGAIEYEKLIGYAGKATRASNSSSFAHLLIILFILMGNIAMILERRQRAQTEGTR